MVYIHKDRTVEAGVLALLRKERGKAQSRDEWLRVLETHGYRLDRTRDGIFVTTLPHGVPVCRLPGDLA